MIIPAVFFATKTILIDDNESFINVLSHNLTTNNIYNTAYTSPQQALDNLISNTLFDEFDNAISQEHSNILEQENFDLKKIINNKFYDLPSVIVIDLIMPNINGIEVCEKIAHLPCKKILLTANHDHKIAVEAFNKKLIDSFILKDLENLTEKLIEVIKQLQLDFFYSELNALYTAINNISNNLLDDNNYQQLCKKYITELKAKEFYLLDDSGSMIINNQLLSVANQDRLNSLYELAELNNVNLENLDNIKSGKKIPVFSDNHKNNIDWNNILHNTKMIKLHDNSLLYYCVT